MPRSASTLLHRHAPAGSARPPRRPGFPPASACRRAAPAMRRPSAIAPDDTTITSLPRRAAARHRRPDCASQRRLQPPRRRIDQQRRADLDDDPPRRDERSLIGLSRAPSIGPSGPAWSSRLVCVAWRACRCSRSRHRLGHRSAHALPVAPEITQRRLAARLLRSLRRVSLIVFRAQRVDLVERHDLRACRREPPP